MRIRMMMMIRRGDFSSIRAKQNKIGQGVWIYNGLSKTRIQVKTMSWIQMGWTTNWFGQSFNPQAVRLNTVTVAACRDTSPRHLPFALRFQPPAYSLLLLASVFSRQGVSAIPHAIRGRAATHICAYIQTCIITCMYAHYTRYTCITLQLIGNKGSFVGTR